MKLSFSTFVAAVILADSTSAAQNFKGSKHERRGLQNKGNANGNGNGRANGEENGRTDGSSSTGSSFSSVYTMTNLPDNGIIVYSRDEANGQLTYEGTESTTGTGGGPLAPAEVARDPVNYFLRDFLESTNSIIVAGKCLLSINAGSDDVTTFWIKSKSNLEVSSKVSSGGTIPVSIAERDGLVYVLNAGDNGSIHGFNLNPGNCVLSPIGSSIELDQEVGAQNFELPRFTTTSPSQVGFLPDGNLLVLIKVDGGGQNFPSPGLGSMNIYTIDPKDGTTSADSLEHIPVSGTASFPYAFTFDGQGRMLLLDGRGDLADDEEVGFEIGTGQVRLLDQDLNEVQVVPTGQGASCWIAYNPINSCVYTANTPFNTISSFKLGDELERVEEIAAEAFCALDFQYSPDGRFLYASACDAGFDLPTVIVWEMSSDCGLVQVQTIGSDLGPIGSVSGLAMYSGEPASDAEITSIA